MNIESRYVRGSPSALSPFLRSDAQGAVLAESLLRPEEELTISEIARRAGVLPAVAHREVTRLIDADVLRDRRHGNNRLVRPNTEHPLWSLMSQIIVETYGPVPVLRELIMQVDGVSAAYIYGSWAARRSGEPGPPPRDLDVLVVDTTPRVDLLDIADAARARLHIDVNIRVVPAADWQAKSDPFLKTVASRPMIALVAHEEGQ